MSGAGSDRRLAALALMATLAAAAIFAWLAWLRPSQDVLWGDEGTYLAMTASLARDGDLAFDEADRLWALERGGEKGVSVILQRTPDGVTYSKPVLYPLVAALPYRVLGETGMLLTNALVLALGLWLAWLYLSRLGGSGHAALTLVAFAGCAAIAPYLLWRMSESLQLTLALAGLVLACGGLRPADGSGGGAASGWLDRAATPWIGGALLGLLTTMRLSNALLGVGVVAACLIVADWSRALKVAVGAVAAVGLMVGLNLLALGVVEPYTAERSSFNARLGYPSEVDHESSQQRFDEQPATHRVHLDVTRVTAWSSWYFLFGRHTGLLAYFPLALILVFAPLRFPDRLGLALLATALGLAAFTLLYGPHNYFGGSTFFGNRYFLIAYPALLVGLRRLPSPRLLLAVLALGLVTAGSAIASVRRTAGLDDSSQSHAAAGIFPLLPYETTAKEIQGQLARFWSQDYVRFTNNWATVRRRSFALHAARPAAELMIASRQRRERMVFLVRPAAAAAAIEWTDGSRLGWRPVAIKEQTRPGVVVIHPGEPRRHQLFWMRSTDIFNLQLIRFALDPERTAAERVDMFYLGNSWTLLSSGRAAVVDATLPTEGITGGSAAATVEIRNNSPVNWSRDSVLPVVLGYRVEGPGGVLTTGRQPLPDLVSRGETIDLEIDIEWPDEPGSYDLVVDLMLHPIYWFEEIGGEPVGRATVEVRRATPRE